ncbi:hypothetical protein [Streptomyces sp. 3213.3]|nr:hypothetical protein [Streptomyces sp. 3213.3]
MHGGNGAYSGVTLGATGPFSELADGVNSPSDQPEDEGLTVAE